MNVLDEKYGTRLLDEPMGEVEKLVERIADAQLLEFSGVDRTGRPRYRFHDLVRLFAGERGQAEDRPGMRAMAFGRVLRHWLALIGMAEPQTWLETEQDALVVAVQRFAELGLDDLSCELAAALRRGFACTTGSRSGNGRNVPPWWPPSTPEIGADRR